MNVAIGNGVCQNSSTAIPNLAIQDWTAQMLPRLPLSICAQLAQLFHETVRQINSRDYGPKQIVAWSPAIQSATAWRDRLQSKQSLHIAKSQSKLLGFAELDPPNPNGSAHIDCFYIHHQHQGQGVGSALLAALEAGAKKQGISLLYVEASITAQPFFSRRGFRVVREQSRDLRSCQFKQFYMEKPIQASRNP